MKFDENSTNSMEAMVMSVFFKSLKQELYIKRTRNLIFFISCRDFEIIELNTPNKVTFFA